MCHVQERSLSLTSCLIYISLMNIKGKILFVHKNFYIVRDVLRPFDGQDGVSRSKMIAPLAFCLNYTP